MIGRRAMLAGLPLLAVPDAATALRSRAATPAAAPVGAAVSLSAAPTATSTGEVMFDSFAGTTTNDKINTMNNWLRARQAANAGPFPAVRFDTRQYDHGVPIAFVSGMTLLGGKDAVVHEYSRGTVLNWQGGSGTSQFVFPTTQPNQGYPSDGSPRDVSLRFIQFQGGGSTHFLPKNDPSSGSYRGKVIWMSNFHSCGWKNFATIWWGWGDGTTIDGVTHVQGTTDTAFFLAGSENCLFSNGAYSFMDTTSATFLNTSTARPFIRSRLTKSTIGQVMVTGRKTGFQMSIEGGQDQTIRGFAFDAQDSDPVYGTGLRISGGENILLDGVNFKGMMADPARAVGGAAANPGWVHITGGRQITFAGCQFRKSGSSQPADSVPVVVVGSGVGPGEVKFGFNNFGGFPGRAVIRQTRAGQVQMIPDVKVSLVAGA